MAEDPSIFAIALETLAVKAFGDMGQTAHMRLIRDRFIAGHSSCELRRYLYSVPPKTPIRDVVDRCRVSESHADPEIRRVSKFSSDPIYPAYVVGDSDQVTKPKSPPDQLEDMFRRLLANMAAPVPVPAPVPEVPMVDKLLQNLVAEIQSRQLAAVSPPEPVGLGNLFRSYLSGQQTSGPQTRQRPIRRDWNGVVYFSCEKLGHAVTRCPTMDESFPSMWWRSESTPGGFIIISPRVAAEHRRTENGD